MTTPHLCFRALLACVAFVACRLACAQSADVTLAFVAGQPGVQARFALSQPTAVLRFAGDGALRKRTWRPEGGATLSEDGNALHVPRAVRRLSVRILPFARDGEIDRVYTPLIPFGDGRAAAVYTEYLLPKGGGVVRLANGGVVLGRAVARGAVAWRANDVATYLVVGDATTGGGTDGTMTIDAAAPPWVSKALGSDVPALMALYRRTFDDGPRIAPWIVVTFDPAGSGSSYRGDTNPGMVRLNLMGSGWRTDGARRSRDLVGFVAHELMHLWNNGLWKEAEGAPIWLHEGGAEAAAQDALHTLGRLSDREYLDEQMANIVACATTRGATIADKVRAGGRIHYVCGASLFYLSSSMLAPRADRVGPLGIWQAMFAARRDSRTYGTADLKRAVARDGASPVDDLMDSKATWIDVLRNRREALHVHEPRDDELRQSALSAVRLDLLVLDLVRKDCKGSIGVGYDRQVYDIEALPRCDSIQANLSARSMGGISMRDEPVRALDHATERCGRGLPLALSDDRGTTIDLPCAQSIALPPGVVVPDTVF